MTSRSLTELMSLRGKKVLIVGGAGHIGRVAADVMLELNAEITLTDRDAAKLAARARELGLDDNHWISANLESEPDMTQAVRVPADRMGGLDIIIFTAAITGTGGGVRQGWAVEFPYQSVEAFRASLNVGLVAPFVMSQELLDEKSDNSPAVLLLFGSIYGLVAPRLSLYKDIQGVPQPPVGYSATKGGTIALTRHLASILAPTIRVNCIIPGGLYRNQPPEFIARYSDKTPLGRMGTEDDMRGAIAFLVTDMSKYVTGTVLTVDGGFTI